MASIASVYIEVLPSTARIAEGIKRALLSADDDVRKAAKRWQKEIESELKDVKIKAEVDADTAKAKAELKRLEREKHTATVDVKVDKASLSKAVREFSSATSGIGRSPRMGRPGATTQRWCWQNKRDYTSPNYPVSTAARSYSAPVDTFAAKATDKQRAVPMTDPVHHRSVV